MIASPRPTHPQRNSSNVICFLSFLACIFFIHVLGVFDAFLDVQCTFHALVLDAFSERQRVFHVSRSSFNVSRSSHSYDTSTLMLIFGFTADDPGNSLHVYENERWRHSFYQRPTIAREYVVLKLMTFPFDLSNAKRTLIKSRRTAAHRPRRKKGRIKTQFEWRKPGVGEQKSVKIVLTDENMTSPTPDSYQLPQASNHRVHGVFPSSPLQTATSGSRRRRTNQRASKDVNPSVTIIDATCYLGRRRTKGRER